MTCRMQRLMDSQHDYQIWSINLHKRTYDHQIHVQCQLTLRTGGNYNLANKHDISIVRYCTYLFSHGDNL